MQGSKNCILGAKIFYKQHHMKLHSKLQCTGNLKYEPLITFDQFSHAIAHQLPPGGHGLTGTLADDMQVNKVIRTGRIPTKQGLICFSSIKVQGERLCSLPSHSRWTLESWAKGVPQRTAVVSGEQLGSQDLPDLALPASATLCTSLGYI
jgi:hypothetical protein